MITRPGAIASELMMEAVVFVMDFDASDLELLQVFQEPERQQRDVGEREVGREHHEESVDVKTVAGERHFQEFDALRAQDFLNLARALLVHA